jgi:hypothetical protein
MFAIFGLGPSEMIVLFLVALLVIGGPIIVVLVALGLVRRSEGARGPDGLSELRAEVNRFRAEVDRLHEEVERLKKGSA